MSFTQMCQVPLMVLRHTVTIKILIYYIIQPNHSFSPSLVGNLLFQVFSKQDSFESWLYVLLNRHNVVAI